MLRHDQFASNFSPLNQINEETVKRLGIARGQQLSLAETANGIELSLFDPEFAEQMRVAEKIMDEYRETLRDVFEQAKQKSRTH